MSVRGVGRLRCAGDRGYSSVVGALLPARDSRRVDGVVFLVVELSDGRPGTIRAHVTDVMGGGPRRGGRDGSGWRWRALKRLVIHCRTGLSSGRSPEKANWFGMPAHDAGTSQRWQTLSGKPPRSPDLHSGAGWVVWTPC
jgi:hypothetical protein